MEKILNYLVPIIIVLGIIGFFAWNKLKEKKEEKEQARVQPTVYPPTGTGPLVVVTPTFDFQWARYKGEPLPAVIIHLYARGFSGALTQPELDAARAAGVIIPPPPAPPTGDAPNLAGFDLVRGGDQCVNVLNQGAPYPFQFDGVGTSELAWASQGNGGWMESWISIRGAAEPIPGTYTKQINGNGAGQTYFPGTGPFTYWLKSERTFRVGVQQK